MSEPRWHSVAWEQYVQERASAAEAIIRAQGRTITAMYNSDMEAGWPRDGDALIAAYSQRYGVNLWED